MGETLAGGNVAIALLANAIATGAILYVLIVALGPISGAHFNPVVTLVMLLQRAIGPRESAGYVAAQVGGAILGVLVAHLMFGEDVFQLSTRVRSGGAQWFSETVAAFGLLLTILLTLKARTEAVPVAVALYIIAAYWFTASTSFANPAVTLARAFSNTFAGIRLMDVPLFILAQTAGAMLALFFVNWMFNEKGTR
jgi:glycerol uptake facilitator-like aquaporin